MAMFRLALNLEALVVNVTARLNKNMSVVVEKNSLIKTMTIKFSKTESCLSYVILFITDMSLKN